MNFQQQIGLTLRIVSHGHASNWRAFVALAAMILMIGGMIAMMWFLSSAPSSDLRPWICGIASVVGLALWNNMLPLAAAQDESDEARK